MLFGYFSCTLLKDTVDVDITVHMLNGIHTFRKDRSTQVSRCSPWGMDVRPFPSLWKKMWDFIEARQAIANPFTYWPYLSRLNPSPCVNQPKATPVKIRTLVSKHNIYKLSQPRKVNLGYYPPVVKQNWVGQATFQMQEAAAQTPTVAIPTHQADASFTFMQPATAAAPAMPTKSLLTISDQRSQDLPLERQCPPTYLNAS